MRVVNEKFHTIIEYDLEKGRLVSTKAIRENIEPIDNITKFAYSDDDYEEVQMYIPNPIKTISQQITDLKNKLTSTDYKVIKCSECQLMGLELPYNLVALHAER
jgi:hypothetical protein